MLPFALCRPETWHRVRGHCHTHERRYRGKTLLSEWSDWYVESSFYDSDVTTGFGDRSVKIAAQKVHFMYDLQPGLLISCLSLSTLYIKR